MVNVNKLVVTWTLQHYLVTAPGDQGILIPGPPPASPASPAPRNLLTSPLHMRDTAAFCDPLVLRKGPF